MTSVGSTSAKRDSSRATTEYTQVGGVWVEELADSPCGFVLLKIDSV